MLIEFSGEHTGNVVMFEKVALRLLKMMGQSSNKEGAIRAEDVPTALNKLQQSLDLIPEEQEQDDAEEDAEVSLRTRAVPLIKMLEENANDNGYVMWKLQ